MTGFDRSWGALLKPGQATDFFQLPSAPAFDPGSRVFTPGNAWWLAQLCHISYVAGHGEADAPPPAGFRQAVFHRHGLDETHSFSADGVQASLLIQEQGRFRVLVFRGSDDLQDWLTNLQMLPGQWPAGGLVHRGFQGALQRIWSGLLPALQDGEAPLFCTGHSLGGALAILSTAQISCRACYTFGSPRIGDAAFCQTLTDQPVFPVIHHRDLVPSLPPALGPLSYHHPGEVCYLRDGQLLVNPPEDLYLRERLDPGHLLQRLGSPQQWRQPLDNLSDHSIINYIAALEVLMPSAA